MIKKTLMVMAGGTGGHVFPGLAVAHILQKRGWHIVWMGNPAGIEAKIVQPQGFEMAWVHFGALRGKGLLRKLKLPFALAAAFIGAYRQIKRVRPDVILGMGGYISFPGGAMSLLAGVPLIIHEQNSIAGLANRVLAKIAKKVVCAFPNALPNSVWLGNPVRTEIAHLPIPSIRFADRKEETLRILVLGGSLGAVALNELVPKGIALIATEKRPKIIHQSGEKHLAKLKENYANAGVTAECVAFIEDMAGAYAWADLVICRSGALTVSELAAAGVASLLVPYPHAVDDHQTHNAQFLVDRGAAILLPQDKLSAESVSLIKNYTRAQLLQMSEQARSLARPDAVSDLATLCERLVK